MTKEDAKDVIDRSRDWYVIHKDAQDEVYSAQRKALLLAWETLGKE